MHLLGGFTDCYFLFLFTVFRTRDKILKTVFRFTKPEIVAKIPKILERKRRYNHKRFAFAVQFQI